MSKPYYEIDKDTQNIIMELQKKCKELDLGNVNFQYYPRPGADRRRRNST